MKTYALTVRGSKAEIINFKHLCFSFDEQLKFSNIIAPPVRFTHNWCMKNWGCSANPKNLRHTFEFTEDDSSIEIVFRCKSSNNIKPIMEGLAQRFPSISFNLTLKD